MDKLTISFYLIIFLFILFFVVGYYISFNNSFEKTYTSAVCSGNVCQDFEFTCKDKQLINSKAISGFVIFDEDWTDWREEKDRC